MLGSIVHASLGIPMECLWKAFGSLLEAPWKPFGSLWKPFGNLLEASWKPFGSIFEAVKAFGSPLEAF